MQPNYLEKSNLELLDHSDIPEPSQIIIGAARNAEGIAKLEPKLLWRVLTEDIVHTHGDRTVVRPEHF